MPWQKGLVFKFQAGNFFQNNPHMLDLTVDLVVDAAPGASPTTGRTMTHLINCYCGSGLYCIGPLLHFKACIDIKVNEVAISEARENAASNGVRNRNFVAASTQAIVLSEVHIGTSGAINDGRGEDDGGNDVKKKSSGLLVWDFPRDTMVVVVNPPRKGCLVGFLIS